MFSDGTDRLIASLCRYFVSGIRPKSRKASEYPAYPLLSTGGRTDSSVSFRDPKSKAGRHFDRFFQLIPKFLKERCLYSGRKRYEKTQEARRSKHDEIPSGECVYFDEAYERLTKLQEIELANVDVNMFKAINNQLINDGCGLFRGRQILPFEHLSRFQNDLID